jgi:hypothetical protein
MADGQKVFNNESQIESIYIDYLRSTGSKPRHKPECPNHSDVLTYEDFVKSADELAEPFSKVVNATILRNPL